VILIHAIEEILKICAGSSELAELLRKLENSSALKVQIQGLKGSSKTLYLASLFLNSKSSFLYLCRTREEASYFVKDLHNFIKKEKILFFPSPYKQDRVGEYFNPALMERTTVLNTIIQSQKPVIVLSYPEAIFDFVPSAKKLRQITKKIQKDGELHLDAMIDFLIESGFEQVDFVSEAGDFSVRGSIIDIYSYANPFPYRIELDDNIVESIRSFDPDNQLSQKKLSEISIIPDIENQLQNNHFQSFLEFIGQSFLIFTGNGIHVSSILKNWADESIKSGIKQHFLDQELFQKQLKNCTVLDLGSQTLFTSEELFEFDTFLQPDFNKNFDLLGTQLLENDQKQIKTYIFSDSARQLERIYEILEDKGLRAPFYPVYQSIHQGFTDRKRSIAIFSEHQIFNRFHKGLQTRSYSKQRYLSLKELYELRPGDYVTHINYGIGIFSGLEKIEVKGKKQEAARLEYKNGDLLYVSIHSLHKISRYVGQEGKKPRLHRLGSPSWENLKNKTKNRVKDIARDLIHLYAHRKTVQGYAFQPDSYLQNELEASFMYEDTPDQAKATADLKADMEKEYPMDRLVCGDVGYGKTEVALRAAFKAVSDSKQVAILVPTTILALQHYKTFRERLRDFPCNIDYLSRFRSAKQEKEIINKIRNARIDIIIGTHKLLSTKITFKDLGLLIIDEEQKFGVASKEKLRNLKVNVDTLSMSATPIPRTLQFSLMGVRDMSIINTPPPNRQAIETHLHKFDTNLIREAIDKELERKGQVFFVHNRISDISQLYETLRDLLPHARIAVAHGRMQSADLEEVMLGFIDSYYDILLSTNIIESGLDIPNANTIIINQAQNFGLSDLYQMRGRVGRSNKKAYCYLLIPSFQAISTDARKRLAAIEEFTDLGSGFNIALRDMDIRGAGNLLGAEQSGFIAEIGIDMYKKILDEAILELRNEEFSDFFKDKDHVQINDTIIDTDFEVLFPDDYINNVEERLVLYNKLNKLSNEKDLLNFQDELVDRFGLLPKASLDLFDLLRVKWIGQNLCIEKILLKNQKLKVLFPAKNMEASHFLKSTLEKMIQYASTQQQLCKFNESSKGLYFIIEKVHNIQKALSIFREIQSLGNKG
jgi:transcription-repair coupling factor (superfamily II helicase)